MNDDLGARQPETKAIINWSEEIQFTASASLHGVISHTLDGLWSLVDCDSLTMKSLKIEFKSW